MKKLFLMLAAIAGLFVLSAQNEASAFVRHFHHFHKMKVVKTPPTPHYDTPNSGGPSAGFYYVAGSTVCTAGTLIIAGSVVGNRQRRQLSQEEAATALVTCFAPPAILLACNSTWQTNNSLPPQTGNYRRNRAYRNNVFCNGLTYRG